MSHDTKPTTPVAPPVARQAATPVARRPRLAWAYVWAYLGTTLGATASVAANVAHSYVPPKDAPDTWTPYTGAVIGAVFWPVALLVALEILVRTPWPDERRWAFVRFGGLVPVVVVAAAVSYRHMSALLTYYGEDGVTATLGPLAPDGLMTMAAGAVIAVTRRRDTRRTATATQGRATSATASPDVAAATQKPVATVAPASTTTVARPVATPIADPVAPDVVPSVASIDRPRRTTRRASGAATAAATGRLRQAAIDMKVATPDRSLRDIAMELKTNPKNVERWWARHQRDTSDATSDPDRATA